jgi:hypothetical protein
MSSFTVTPNLLRALERSLLGLAVELDNGDTSYGRDEVVAGDGVNGADEIMGNFFLNWSASLEVTGKNIETVAKKLSEAAAGYEKTDTSCMPANPTGKPETV